MGVDLTELIDEIFVSPIADEWYSRLVRTIVRGYDLHVPVRHSSLAAAPVFLK